ncbi:hypothetical protein CR513_60900, partial [Mucuna pruriens]
MELKIPTFTSKLSNPSNKDDTISYKLFLDTLKGFAMQWFAGFPPRTIHTFNDLATVFVLQFAANHAKRLKVADLFNILQVKSDEPKATIGQMRDQRGKGVQEDERRWNDGEHSKDQNNARNRDRS